MTPTSTIELRAMTDRDLEFSYKVFASTREDELRFLPLSDSGKEQFLKSQFDLQRKYYLEQFARAAYQVIELDGIAIGRLIVDHEVDQILILDIALLPAYRGAGTGSILMRQIQDEARAALLPVRLHVERFNAALRWYERFGFRQVEDLGVYLFMEWLPTAAEGGNR